MTKMQNSALSEFGKKRETARVFRPRALSTAMRDAQGRMLLTRRQMELAKGVADGLSNKGLATLLGTTEGTIKVHMSLLMRKTGFESRLQIALAFHRGEFRSVADAEPAK